MKRALTRYTTSIQSDEVEHDFHSTITVNACDFDGFLRVMTGVVRETRYFAQAGTLEHPHPRRYFFMS
jgi:hypothetical protein